MKKIKKRYSLLLILICCAFGAYAESSLVLPNPNLDEDYENDGVPDKWIIPETTDVDLVYDKAVIGKAAKFTDGYILLEAEMAADELAGYKACLSFDAAGEEDAALGVKFGYLRRNKDGREKFIYSRAIWNKPLGSDYQRVGCNFIFPTNALKGKVVLRVYRSNKKGTVWLDNFKLFVSKNEGVTEEQKKQLTVADRDWRYLGERVEKVKKAAPELKDELQEISGLAADIRQRIRAEDTLLLEDGWLEEQLQQSNIALNRMSSGGKDTVVWLSDAFIRQEPTEVIPAEVIVVRNVLSLGDEYQAFGITIANCIEKPVVYPVEIKGLENIASGLVVRRQILVQNWYDKEKELIADPMTILPRKDGKWLLEVQPGGINKLMVGFKLNKNVSGTFPVGVRVGGQELSVPLEVLECNLPSEPKFNHMVFIYPEQEPAGSNPEVAAQDLSDHYVTAMEFPYVPQEHRLNRDGTRVDSHFENSRQFRWAKAYSEYGIKLALFWAGTYTTFNMVDGEKMPYLDENRNFYPAWKTGFETILGDWMAFSERNGVGPENYLIMPVDEVASGKDFMNPPGKDVLNAVEVFKSIRKIAPKVSTITTMTDYGLYEDVKAYLPSMDIVMPVWPYRTLLTRNVPSGYNSRKVFFEKILPLLKKEQEKRDLQIWSYRVDPGKKVTVLESSRAYPICAVGLGFTGISHWAYNCSRGLTWDDTDGGLLDYNMVYDGCEEHPDNLKYNVEDEIVVPSIRWEALRLGFQDAQILLYLKECVEKGMCDSETASEINAILKQAEEYGRELNYTYEGVVNISERVRRLSLKVETGE